MTVATDPRSLPRGAAARMGREALEIIHHRQYQSAQGRRVEIGESIDRAKRGTVSYPPEAALPDVSRDKITRVTVRNETTIAAAERLLHAGMHPVVLNFASATHPGGGFLAGARAQEESLARSSALFACLEGQNFYQRHQKLDDPMYTDHVLYSPEVPFFRRDDQQLLDAPLLVSVITCAAPNLWQSEAWPPEKLALVPAAFQRRIRRILAIGAAHHHDAIVLGAWGCGAFRNDATTVAQIFGDVVNEFAGAFAEIDFAIVDTSPKRETIGPFERVFAVERPTTA